MLTSLGGDNNKMKVNIKTGCKEKRVMKLSDLVVDSASTLHQNCPPNFGGVPEWPKGADCKSAA